MSLDIQNRVRGACLSCGECPAYLCVTGRVLCDYCGCPPARHQLERLPASQQEEEKRLPKEPAQEESDKEEEEEEEEG
jgi:hypothetical protein